MSARNEGEQPAWWSGITIADVKGASTELESMVSGRREMDLERARRLWRLLLALGRTEEMRRILDRIEAKARVSGADTDETEAWLDRQWPLVQELLGLEKSLIDRYPEYPEIARRLAEIESTMQASSAAIGQSKAKMPGKPFRIQLRKP